MKQSIGIAILLGGQQHAGGTSGQGLEILANLLNDMRVAVMPPSLFTCNVESSMNILENRIGSAPDLTLGATQIF